MKRQKLMFIFTLLALLLLAAPAQAGGDVTVCDEAHFLDALDGGGPVTFSCSGTITMTSFYILETDTTIDGSGEEVTISGGNNVQLFTVDNGVTLNLVDLTVADARGGSYSSGAAVNNSGTLTTDQVIFRGNSSGTGGAISNSGTLTINKSTFANNAAFGNNGGLAGAIFSNNGDVTIKNSTFAGNTSNSAGAIYNLNGMLEISNSTFFNNHVDPGFGGAIYNANNGNLTVTNSTFSANSSTAFQGGGAIRNSEGGTVTLENSIVANSPSGDNCVGEIMDGGGNLSYPDTTCPGINQDPFLGALQDNGGPTMTMALLAGSAAIDAADDAICAAPPVNNLDQRGVARPVGSHCDIGAFESEETPAPNFTLSAKPAAITVCIPNDALYSVSLAPINGFDQLVSLSAVNYPAGSSATFNPNSVTPPGISDLTIGDTGAATPGNYSIDIIGAAATQTHTTTVNLELLPPAPAAAPALLAPADESEDIPVQPEFSWEPVDGAENYALAVATDPAFANVVYSTTVTQTAHTISTTLDYETQYFWHVSAQNPCGSGPSSTVFRFATADSAGFDHYYYFPVMLSMEDGT